MADPVPAIPWNDDYVVDLRGSEYVNPATTTDADDVSIALAGILPMRVVFGEILTTGALTMKGRNEARMEFAMKPKPFTVKASVRTDCQDYGYCWALQKTLAHTYIHILGLYKVGSSHGAGVIPRARLSGGTTANTFFSAEVVPPISCFLDGEARPSPDFDNGWVTLDFTLVKITPET